MPHGLLFTGSDFRQDSGQLWDSVLWFIGYNNKTNFAIILKNIAEKII